jgi:hypothetical protein
MNGTHICFQNASCDKRSSQGQSAPAKVIQLSAGLLVCLALDSSSEKQAQLFPWGGVTYESLPHPLPRLTKLHAAGGFQGRSRLAASPSHTLLRAL